MNERKEYHRKYYLANRERMLGNAKEYYSEHADKQNANKRWKYAHRADYRKYMLDKANERRRRLHD